MPNYKIHFVADNKNYTTTVPAETSGEAQTKFSSFFTNSFKAQKGIKGSAYVKQIELLKDKNDQVVEQLRSIFDNAFKPFKPPF